MTDQEPKLDRGKPAILLGLLFWVMQDPKRYLALFAGMSALIVGLWISSTSSGSSFLSLAGKARGSAGFAQHGGPEELSQSSRGPATGAGALGDGLLGVNGIRSGDQFGKDKAIADAWTKGGETGPGGAKDGGQKDEAQGASLSASAAAPAGLGVGNGESPAAAAARGAGAAGEQTSGGAAQAKPADNKCRAKNPTEPMTSNGLCPPGSFKAPAVSLCFVCSDACQAADHGGCPLSTDNLKAYATQLYEDRIPKMRSGQNSMAINAPRSFPRLQKPGQMTPLGGPADDPAKNGGAGPSDSNSTVWYMESGKNCDPNTGCYGISDPVYKCIGSVCDTSKTYTSFNGTIDGKPGLAFSSDKVGQVLGKPIEDQSGKALNTIGGAWAKGPDPGVASYFKNSGSGNTTGAGNNTPTNPAPPANPAPPPTKPSSPKGG